MAQLLPKVNSFGENFAQAIGRGASSAMDFQNKLALQKAHQESQYAQQLAMQRAKNLPKELEHQREINQFRNDIKNLEELKGWTGSQLSPFEKNFDPTNIKIGGRQIIEPFLNRTAIEKRAQIAATGSGVAEKVYRLLGNTGVVSDAKIEHLMSKFFIKPDDSERVYTGKLNYLKSILQELEGGGDPAFIIQQMEDAKGFDTSESPSKSSSKAKGKSKSKPDIGSFWSD